MAKVWEALSMAFKLMLMDDIKDVPRVDRLHHWMPGAFGWAACELMNEIADTVAFVEGLEDGK